MAVLMETSMGDIVIDLYVKECPVTCTNFIKLCKLKYYHGCLFFNLQPNYIIQTGDPTGTGRGGASIYSEMSSGFADEIHTHLKMDKVGLVCMAHDSKLVHANNSQFFITLRGEDLVHLNGKHTIFGEVAEGLEILEQMNNLYIDDDGRPYQDIRIKHTYILDDPFPDPLHLKYPDSSPMIMKPINEIVSERIPYESSLDIVNGISDTNKLSEEELIENIKKKEAKSRAIVLEMTGDIPDADIKPPEEVLFVCKLNPVTTDADLELIFSRFGTIKSCEIIRDNKTGDSLNYAFIEYTDEASCIRAYDKMNNVLIDDRRIKVDFSQSVSKLWNRFNQRGTSKPVQKGIAGDSSHSTKRGDSRDRKNRDNSRDRKNRDNSRDRKKRDDSRDRKKRDDSRDRKKRDDSRDRKKRDDSRDHRKGDDRRGYESHDKIFKGKGRDRSRSREKKF